MSLVHFGDGVYRQKQSFSIAKYQSTDLVHSLYIQSLIIPNVPLTYTPFFFFFLEILQPIAVFIASTQYISW